MPQTVAQRQRRAVYASEAPDYTSGTESLSSNTHVDDTVPPTAPLPSTPLSLDALTNRPEIQELFKKAAERRAAWNKQTPAGCGSRVRFLEGNESRSHGQVRFSQSPRMRAPQVATSPEAKLPAHYIVLGNSKGGLTDRGSANTARGHSETAVNDSSGIEHASTCHNETSNEADTPANRDTEAASSSATHGAMSDQEYLCDEENETESSEKSSTEFEQEDTEEIHVPMSFQIPPEKLRAAMLAPPKTAASYYDQRLYRGPEDQLLSIHYCHTLDIANRVLPYFLEEKVLGFDIEWKPRGSLESIKENASLIQIASEDRIALFHISLYPGTTPEELLPPDLRTIIESPDIFKVGVAIKGDFSRLAKYLGVKPKGVFELSRLHNLVEHYNTNPSKAGSRKLYALAKQVHEHLQLPMDKGPVRESDWSKRLQMEQMAYAATDAYASLRIYDALEGKRKLLRPIPPRPELCDYDEASRPRTTPRGKPIPKAAPISEKEKAVQGSAEPTERVDEEGEASAYETAAEDLVDSHELEDSSDSEVSATSTAEVGDSDADYVPPTLDRPQIEDQLEETPPPRQPRRLGRINLRAFAGPDPVYPTLPTLPSASYDVSHSKLAVSRPAQPAERHDPAERAAEVSMLKRDGEASISVEMEDLQAPSASLDREVKHGPEDSSITRAVKMAQEPVSVPSKVTSNVNAALAVPENTTAPSSLVPKVLGAITSADVSSPTASRKRKVKATDAATVPTSEIQPQAEPTPTSGTAPKASQVETTPRPPEYVAADTWAQSYLYNSIPSASGPVSSTPSRIRATLSHLRAYHMWHHQHMSVVDIAGHLRDPPLAESTVCNYILQAVGLERLEYRRQDLRVVLAALPLALRVTKWKWMVDKVGGLYGS